MLIYMHERNERVLFNNHLLRRVKISKLNVIMICFKVSILFFA